MESLMYSSPIIVFEEACGPSSQCYEAKGHV